MITPVLQGAIPPLLNVEEMLTGYSVTWLLLYLGLLFTCGMLVYAKLLRDHALVRRYFFSQLGWALLLTALLPRLFPLIWPPVALSWLISAFLLLLEVRMPQSRRQMPPGLVMRTSQRTGAEPRSARGTAASSLENPDHSQQKDADGDD